MIINTVRIKNFRGIFGEELEISLDEKLTVFIGSNGAGKSTILDAVALVLTRIISLIRYQKLSGATFKDTDFPVAERFDETSVTIMPKKGSVWRIRKEKSAPKMMSLADRVYTDSIRSRIFETEERCSIPVFVYYGTHRAVLDIPLKIRKKHSFSLLETYDDAFKGSANFRHFFEWFRNREDLENEIKNQEGRDYSDQQLDAVRQAIQKVMVSFSGLSVRRNPLRMVISKGEKQLRVDHLSEGEKVMLAMVGDLARRLAIANPQMPNPLKGEGIVLIDEVELHFHPAWQRMILGKLCSIFENCQFVVTTHSPQIVGEVSHEQIRMLSKDEKGQVTVDTPDQALGLTSGEVLTELMNTPERDAEISNKMNDIYRFIDGENFYEAKKAITELTTKLNGSIPEIVRMEGLITMLECNDDSDQ
jgi:predicted ATP-binding protein involved in virulence